MSGLIVSPQHGGSKSRTVGNQFAVFRDQKIRFSANRMNETVSSSTISLLSQSAVNPST